MRIILAITGATGAIYGVRLLEELYKRQVEVHMVVSRWGAETIAIETGQTVKDLEKLAFKRYEVNDLGASIASGSFHYDGMVIAPCSMKTLSAIAHGYADNLITRAADVALKERRRLLLIPRETPLNAIHLENMLQVTRAGAVLMPPMPAFYNHPRSIDDLVNHLVGRVLDIFNIENDLVKRWGS